MIYKQGALSLIAAKALQEKLGSFRVGHRDPEERQRTWRNEEEWRAGLAEVRQELARRGQKEREDEDESRGTADCV